jgi:hypothetical protein
MSVFIEEITLVNIGDENDARRGYIPPDQVRRLTVNAVVDTWAWTGTLKPRNRRLQVSWSLGHQRGDPRKAGAAGAKNR